ncbi:MAG: YggS family pyridoxal phosphate-dependent enzyme [Gammaproteobacteria bacterium]|nr:YggS family pyridoxal phosphate-dependent enzyme [Gammaproteobacteria bacterium]MDH3767181.1 YggS family pyridoxal phosphate-dependent enzyme [Gammaproteobacteria bacterium]
MTEVTVTLRVVHDLIATAAEQAGREPTDIRLIAVSKTKPAPMVREALAAGQRDFAENYLQEATVKIQALSGSGAIWHFIGRVQSNKTRDIATNFDWVQTIDRERIARRLDAHRPAGRPALNVCIQVRLSADTDRPGAQIDEVAQLATTIETLPHLRLRGLMGMPPLETNPARGRAHFDRLRSIYDCLRQNGHNLDTLSMGTTADLTSAIAAGATMIRIGTAIFGSR